MQQRHYRFRGALYQEAVPLLLDKGLSDYDRHVMQTAMDLVGNQELAVLVDTQRVPPSGHDAHAEEVALNRDSTVTSIGGQYVVEPRGGKMEIWFFAEPEEVDEIVGAAGVHIGNVNRTAIPDRAPVFQNQSLADAINNVPVQDFFDQDGAFVLDVGEEIDRYYSGPGRQFGRVYEVMWLAEKDHEEDEAAFQALAQLNRQAAELRRRGLGEDEEDATFVRFDVDHWGDGWHLVVDEGGWDV